MDEPNIIKNAAAVELGRLGGKKGGPARAAKLSPERRSEIAKTGAAKRWGKRANPCCDYAHYYLGSKCRFTYGNGEFFEFHLDAILYDGAIMTNDISANRKNNSVDDWHEVNNFRTDGNFQLFLIDPTLMSAKQKTEYRALCYACKDAAGNVLRIVDTPQSLVYLFRNGIDAFELIENGHALELRL